MLRALCCLGIMMAHSCAYAESIFELDGGTLDYIGRGGMLNFVTFFFLLSEFLIARQIHRGGTTVKSFLIKRFWGIYPVYWMAVATVVIIRLIVWHGIEVSGGFWKSLLLIPGPWTFACMSVEWTLLYEVLFYCLVICFFLPNIRKLFPVATIIGFTLSIMQYDGVNKCFLLAFFSFYNGVFLYFASSLAVKVDKIWNKHVGFCKVMASVTFLISMLLLDGKYNTFVDSFGYYCGVCTFTSICVYLFLNVCADSKNLPVKIGDSSYAMYLLHPVILNAFFTILKNWGMHYNYILHIFVLISGGVASYLISIWFRIIVKAIRPVNIKREFLGLI